MHGVPKLADIGLVADLAEAHSFVGTEGFIPPEGPGSIQADVYSLGKVLYETSTGRDRLDFPELPTRIDESEQRTGLLELNEIILRACDHDPAKRYESAQAMHADLLFLQSGKSIKRMRSIERKVALLTRLAIAVCLGAVLAATAYLFQKRQSAQFQELADANQRLAENAERQRQRAEKEKDESSRFLYIANMNLIQNAWEANNIQRVRQLLSETASYRDRGFEWYFWQRQLHRALQTLSGHTAEILAVAFVPGSNRAVTTSRDSTTRLWDADDGKELFVLRGHSQNLGLN